jgi:hypothetical protein
MIDLGIGKSDEGRVATIPRLANDLTDAETIN